MSLCQDISTFYPTELFKSTNVTVYLKRTVGRGKAFCPVDTKWTLGESRPDSVGVFSV